MTARRNAPAHVRRAWETWNLATIAWETARELACSDYATERAEWQDANPAPQFREYLTAEYAAMRHAADRQAVAA